MTRLKYSEARIIYVRYFSCLYSYSFESTGESTREEIVSEDSSDFVFFKFSNTSPSY